jgi:hypothetical protein
VGASPGAQVLLEGNYFRNVKFPTLREPGALIQSLDNVYVDTGDHQLDFKSVPEPKDKVFTPPYKYKLDPVSDLPALLQSRGGVGSKWGQPPVY